MSKTLIYRLLQAIFILCLMPPLYGHITQNDEFLASFKALGYPQYLSQMLSVAYLLGMAAILQSKFVMIKEWAYAGFTFALFGAFFSHLLSDEGMKGIWALVTLAFLLGAYRYQSVLKPNS